MTIGKICTSTVVLISENAPVQEAAKLMQENNVGSVVVVKDTANDPTPIGIVTDRDIVTKLITQKTDIEDAKVIDVADKNLLTLSANEGIKKSIEAMTAKGVRRAPIVDQNNKVCGITTVDDLVVMIASELQDLANLVQTQIDGSKGK